MNFIVINRFIVSCFLSWFLIFANYGILDCFKILSNRKHLQKDYESILIEKKDLLQKVKKLSGPDIDIDLLEIQVRSILAFARKNEKVYFLK